MMRLLVAAALLALPAAAQGPRFSPQDMKALHDYELTQGKVDKLLVVGQKMRAYAEKHPEVRQQGDLMRGKTLDESVKSMEAKPELVSMMKAEGVTPREFVLGMMSMVSAGMWAAMSQRYPDAKMPEEINPKNVTLLQSHPEIMQKWEQTWSDPGRARHMPRKPDPAGGDGK
jgi:hypothetical protein